MYDRTFSWYSMTLCRSPALRVDAYWLTSRPLKWHSLIQRRVHSRRLRGPRTTRATLPRVPDHFYRPKQRPRPQARRCGSAQCQNHFCVKALPARLVGTVKQDMRASEMAGGMLGTVVCVCEDGADARAARSDKLASRFTDSECPFEHFRRLAALEARNDKKSARRRTGRRCLP